MNIEKSVNVALAINEKNRGWLIEKTCISKSQLSTMLKRNAATLDTLSKIANAFEMKLSEFIANGEEGEIEVRLSDDNMLEFYDNKEPDVVIAYQPVSYWSEDTIDCFFKMNSHIKRTDKLVGNAYILHIKNKLKGE